VHSGTEVPIGKLVQDDGWRLPDELWARLEPLLPERPPHPLGCHNLRVSDRAAMDAIFFFLGQKAQARGKAR
jgi:transposase